MGRSGSKLVQKVTSHFSGSEESTSVDSSGYSGFCIRRSNALGGTPFVLYRRGSMYFDEDDDLAHEFYEEVPPVRKGCKATMKKIFRNLRPQGDVAYKYPRIHVDFPVILYQG